MSLVLLQISITSKHYVTSQIARPLKGQNSHGQNSQSVITSARRGIQRKAPGRPRPGGRALLVEGLCEAQAIMMWRSDSAARGQRWRN